MLSSTANPRVKEMRLWLAGQASLFPGCVPVEGVKFAREALEGGLRVEAAWLAADKMERENLRPLVEELESRHTPLTVVTGRVFAAISATESPQGILLVVRPPSFSWEKVREDDKLILVACAIQDPGNLGSLLRSAEAFGSSAVVVTEGSASPLSAKLLRASAGALLRVPVLQGEAAGDVQKKLRELNFQQLAAAGRGEKDFRQACFTGRVALWIGNEGAGLPAEILAAAQSRITIPLEPPVESLNAAVAASIILCEAARQRKQAARPGAPGPAPGR